MYVTARPTASLQVSIEKGDVARARQEELGLRRVKWSLRRRERSGRHAHLGNGRDSRGVEYDGETSDVNGMRTAEAVVNRQRWRRHGVGFLSGQSGVALRAAIGIDRTQTRIRQVHGRPRQE